MNCLSFQLSEWLKEETGYQAIQGTKLQTLAFGLSDSPAGLAAWIAEKFRSRSDCAGDPENAISRDEMLANISLYWFTGAIGTSFWPYYARLHGLWPIPEGETVKVPTGYAAFPKEIVRPPRSVAEKTYTDIRRWSLMPKGGHFAALEQPDLLARDTRILPAAARPRPLVRRRASARRSGNRAPPARVPRACSSRTGRTARPARTMQNLRAHRQLVVRESGPRRATRPSIEATQRWTVSHMVTSMEAAQKGYGYAWFPEERIRAEPAAGTLKRLPLREGGERFGQLYLVFADRDAAGPGTLRLAQIIRESVPEACEKH